MIIFASLQNFKSYSKSMKQNINNDFKEKFLYVRAGTLAPTRNKDILTNQQLFYVVGQRFRMRKEA